MKSKAGLVFGVVGFLAQAGLGFPAAHAEVRSSSGTGKVELEIPVEKLLMPAVGFEEKNEIQAVLYGHLPNACYTLGGYSIRKMSDGKTIQVRQYAMKDTTGICAEEALLPDHLRLSVPFTAELSCT